jgi:hypothetical protein
MSTGLAERFRSALRAGTLDPSEPGIRTGLAAGWQVAVGAVVLLAIVSRSPSLFTNAQFYCEDGKVWYANAYNSGWLHTLFWPNVGYLCVAERLGAGVALLVPLLWAPLVMACIGTFCQWLPVGILLSSRCQRWASLRTRFLFAVVYVVLPNTQEIHVVLTNAMWHLALAAALLGFSTAPVSWWGRAGDCALFALAALSGPFCLVLAPVLAVFWWVRRQRWTLVTLGMVFAACITQIAFLMQHDSERAMAALGATPRLFVMILGGNVFAGAVLGGLPIFKYLPFAVLLLSFVGGLGVSLYCLAAANLEIKLFLLLCMALLLAGLHSPMIAGPDPMWDRLTRVPFSRYWFFPMLGFLWAAIWCLLYARVRVVQAVAALYLLALPIGVIHNWRFPPFADEHFAASVERFESAKPGEHVIIAIAPEAWTMDLVKKTP